MKYDKLLCPAIFVFSAAYNFPLISMHLNPYDEGIILAGADRVLHGDLPYVDFWTMYPPGQFYSLALLFKLFGSSVLVERIYDIAVRSLLSVFSFLITKKLGFSNRIALISWGMSLVWTGSSELTAYPVYPAILLIFVGAYFFLHYLETNQFRWLILCGVFMVLSALYRHDLGLAAAVGVLITLSLRRILHDEVSWRPIFWYAVGVVSTGTPILAVLLIGIGAEPLVDQLLRSPARIMGEYRGLPYPPISLDNLRFVIIPLAPLVGLVASSLFVTRRRSNSRFGYGLFLLSTIATLFINHVRVRSDDPHLIPVAIVTMTIIPVLLYVAFSFSTTKRTQNAVRLLVVICVLGLGAIFHGPIDRKINSFDENYLAAPPRSVIEKAGYARMPDDLRDVVLNIQEETAADERIYVGVADHNKFILNDVIIYFLAERGYSTKYHELHPGVANTGKVQREIVSEIKAAAVKRVVLAERFWYEPNRSSVDSKIEVLDDYISEHFELAQRIGEYEVWTTKEKVGGVTAH